MGLTPIGQVMNVKLYTNSKRGKWVVCQCSICNNRTIIRCDLIYRYKSCGCKLRVNKIKYAKVTFHNDYVSVETKGKILLIDKDDYEKIKNYSINTSDKYPRIWIKKRPTKLHRYLLNYDSSKFQVDHIDGNVYNNRRNNLRICTRSQNNMNRRKSPKCSSKYKGVSFHKKKNKWQIAIFCNRKRILIDYFKDEIEAAKAYDNKARELFGDYGTYNFPLNGERSAINNE